MRNSQNLLSGKGKYLVGSILLLFSVVICAAFSLTDGEDYAIARREILLRRIGHELLLQSGDVTSRVLPVKKIAEREYQISFEKDLAFLPDLLMSITRRFLTTDPLAGDYVVNVLNSSQAGVVYGYAISKNEKDDIVSCKGRKQPKAAYVINVKFKPAGTIATNGYFLGSLPFLAFVGFLFFRSVKPGKALHDDGQIALGSAVFDAKNRKLIMDGQVTDLTGTESRVLRLLALAPNETITRSRLQKEIWEDEGVIVGRSLDMFISKLRKKLEADATINIVVVRGKGYRLEINS